MRYFHIFLIQGGQKLECGLLEKKRDACLINNTLIFYCAKSEDCIGVCYFEEKETPDITCIMHRYDNDFSL